MYRFLSILFSLTLATSAFAATAKATDQEITRKVNEILKTGWFSQGTHRVTMQVKEGVVTLSGSIKTEEDKNRLEQEILNTMGVVNVENRLRVIDKKPLPPKQKQPTPPQQTPPSNSYP